MAKFGVKSKENLGTCHQDLQTVFYEVVKNFDCSVVYGYRSPEIQFELYKKGRELINGKWVLVDKKKRVTNCDGIDIKSNHNTFPSMAADVCPYPTMYSDMNTIRHFAGYVLGVARTLKAYGAIESDIVCGIDWDNDNDLSDQSFFDAVHFQIKT